MWLALVGGFVGVGILFGPALHFASNEARHPAIGISILLVSSFIWSVGSLYSRVAKHAASPFLTAAQQMLCGGMLLLFVGIATGELRRLHPGSISMLSLGSFIYLVIIGAVVGYTAYIWLLRHCEPAKVATYAYVNPIVAVLLGTLFAGETVTLRTLIAAALIIGSVALVITAQQLRARAEPPVSVALEPAD
jgi:drug/metabolite transporter (DMT)-like permease